MRINVGRLNHLRSAEADAEVDRWDTRGTVISDRAAVTIAAWYCSPAPRDMPFTTLAQKGEADSAELLDAIARELSCGPLSEGDDLRALRRWVGHKVATS